MSDKKQIIELESDELGKRVYIYGGPVTTECPLCGHVITRDLKDMPPLSYPGLGGGVSLYFTCEKDHGTVSWVIKGTLKGQLEIPANPELEEVYSYDDEAAKALEEKGF